MLVRFPSRSDEFSGWSRTSDRYLSGLLWSPLVCFWVSSCGRSFFEYWFPRSVCLWSRALCCREKDAACPERTGVGAIQRRKTIKRVRADQKVLLGRRLSGNFGVLCSIRPYGSGVGRRTQRTKAYCCAFAARKRGSGVLSATAIPVYLLSQ